MTEEIAGGNESGGQAIDRSLVKDTIQEILFEIPGFRALVERGIPIPGPRSATAGPTDETSSREELGKKGRGNWTSSPSQQCKLSRKG